jgi:hypothetical protein
MICAGTDAATEYGKLEPRYAKLAYACLTASQHAATEGQRANET